MLSPKVSRFWLPTSTNSFFWSLPRACGLRWEHRLSGKATASLSNSALSLSQETYDVRTSLSDIRIIWFFYWSIIKTSYYTIQCHHVKDWSFRNMYFCNAPKNDDPLVLNSERPKQICSFQWMKGYELLLVSDTTAPVWLPRSRKWHFNNGYMTQHVWITFLLMCFRNKPLHVLIQVTF